MFKNVVHFIHILIFAILSFSIDPSKAQQAVTKSALQGIPHIEVISFNVGNAGDNLVDAALNSHCPNFKLCRPQSIQSLKAFFATSPVDLLLLQETQGIEQVLGTAAGGPLLDPNSYDAHCDYQACVAWNKSSLQLHSNGCRISSNSKASGINCWLEKEGFAFQAISAYFPALIKVFPNYSEGLAKRRELSARIFLGKDEFADPNLPLLVAGDFNTANETLVDDYSRPYPDGFYTLVGRHVRGYGSPGGTSRGVMPEKDFFGAYQQDKPKSFITYSKYGFKKQIDQMFANFGFRVEDPESRLCRFSGGSRFAGLNAAALNEANDFDHYPIFGRVALTTH